MKYVVHGFMLIELIISVLIASMVSGVLLTALYQGNRIQLMVDDMIYTSERIAIVAHQLEKDLSGAFVPVQAEKKRSEKKSDSANVQSGDEKKSADTQNKAENKADTKDNAEQKDTQKKEPKIIEKIFSSTNKDGNLDALTFITNNPLVVFVGKDVGVVKSKVARVQYTLKPEPDKKGLYALFRQESNELDLAEYKNVRSYEVISGIKSCKVNFTARIEKKQDKKTGEQASGQEPKISYEYKTMSEWVSEQKKESGGEQSDKEKTEFPRVPHSVEFKITLWDKQEKKDKEFTIVCAIPVDATQSKKEQKQPAAPSAKDDKNSQNSSNAPKPSGQPPAVASAQGKSQEELLNNGVTVLTNTLNSLTKLLKQM